MESNVTSSFLRGALKIFENESVSTVRQKIRTKYVLGSIIANNGAVAEGRDLMIAAATERYEIDGTNINEKDTREDYDALVPYWAW